MVPQKLKRLIFPEKRRDWPYHLELIRRSVQLGLFKVPFSLNVSFTEPLVHLCLVRIIKCDIGFPSIDRKFITFLIIKFQS